MKFGKLAGLVLAFSMVGGVVAQAQVGVYGMFSASRFGGIQCLSSGTVVGGVATASPACSNGTAGVPATGGTYGTPFSGSVSPAGGLGGVYYDFRNFGPMRFGIDVRAGEVHANKSAVSSAGGDGIAVSDFFLAGARGSFRTPIHWMKPYVGVSAGYARSNATEPNIRTYDKFLQYQGTVGLDLKLFPILDLRLIELGAGNMNRVGTGSGSSSIGVLSIGAGVVFHLPQS